MVLGAGEHQPERERERENERENERERERESSFMCMFGQKWRFGEETMKAKNNFIYIIIITQVVVQYSWIFLDIFPQDETKCKDE